MRNRNPSSRWTVDPTKLVDEKLRKRLAQIVDDIVCERSGVLALASHLARRVNARPPALVNPWQWNIRPEHVPTIAERAGADRIAALGLCSMHRSGFVREAALGLLESALPDGLALSFVTRRVADWVPKIAGSAEMLLCWTLPDASANDIAVLLPDIDALRRLGRETDAIAAVRRDALRRDDVVAALRARLQRKSRGFSTASTWEERQSAFAALLEIGRADDEILLLALSDQDTMTRRAAARTLKDIGNSHRIASLLPALFGDRQPGDTAADLLAFVCERAPELAPDLCDAALLAPSERLRRAARFYSRRDSETLASMARALLRNCPRPRRREENLRAEAALSTLIRCGKPGDLAIVEAFLSEENAPRVRRTAARFLANHDPVGGKEALRVCLRSMQGAYPIAHDLINSGNALDVIDESLVVDILTVGNVAAGLALARILPGVGEGIILISTLDRIEGQRGRRKEFLRNVLLVAWRNRVRRWNASGLPRSPSEIRRLRDAIQSASDWLPIDERRALLAWLAVAD